MLKRTHFLGERKTENNTDVDNQNHEGSHSEKVFARSSKTAHDTTIKRRNSQNLKENRYSVADKIDFGSYICFMFAYILFNIIYLIQYTN